MVDIQTDVDKLIEILKSAPDRMFTYEELSDLTGMGIGALKKWVRILEENDDVKIEYSFSNEKVRWIGTSPAYPIVESRPGSPSLSTGEIDLTDALTNKKAGTDIEYAAHAEMEFRKKQKYRQLLQEKERLQKLIEQKKNRGRFGSEGKEATDFSVGAEETPRHDEQTGTIDEASFEHVQETRAGEGSENIPAIENSFGFEAVQEQGEESASDSTVGVIEKSTGAGKKESIGSSRGVGTGEGQVQAEKQVGIGKGGKLFKMAQAASKPIEIDPEIEKFSGKLTAHMQRVKKKAGEIDKLRLEKKRLLREVYAPLEAKMESELEEITDKILQYEHRLLALREHVSSIPKQVSEVAGMQEKMDSVSHEMQKVYDETNALVEQSLGSINSLYEQLETRMQDAQSFSRGYEEKISRMQDRMAELSSLQADVEAKVEEARIAVENERKKLAQAQESLQKIALEKSGLEGEIEGMHSEISSHKGQLSEISTHLERLKKIEEWVRENQKQYKERLAELSKAIGQGDREYMQLRETVEASFVRKYLKDLRRLSESYEFELVQAQKMEENVDMEIEKKRGELAALIEEGKRLSQMQEMQLEEMDSKEQEVLNLASNRQGAISAMMKTSRERDRIREYIREVVEGKAKKAGKRKTGIRGKRKAGKSKAKKAGKRKTGIRGKKAGKSKGKRNTKMKS